MARPLTNLATMKRAAETLERIGADVRYAARGLAGSPGFTLAAILTLGVGLGATVAIFSLNYEVLLKPLPYRDAGQLVAVWGDASYRGVPKSNVSAPDYGDWRRQVRTMSDLALYLDDFGTTATGADGRAERIDVRMVSGHFFELLGVAPVVGRALRPEDDVEGAAGAAVISHAYWQRRFGGAAQIIGTFFESEPGRFRIVGVMPASFQFGARSTDVWLPLRPAFSTREWEARTNYSFEVIGRMKPGVNVLQAQQDLDTIARQLAAVHLGANEPRGARVLALRDEFAGSARRDFAMLFGGAAAALLVACLNVAHLLLLRGVRRHRELAVRASLGASRGRLIQQLMTESVLLTVAASAVGILVHQWTASYFTRFVPTGMAGIAELGISGPVIVFTLLAGALTVCLAGLMPALRISSVRLAAALQTRQASASGRRSSRARRAIVACEIAVAVLLMVCASLFVGTMWRLQAVDPGFNPANLLTVSVVSRQPRHAEQALERVLAIPDVVSAGIGTAGPLEGFPGRFSWTIDGRNAVEAFPETGAQRLGQDAAPRALLRTASANFLSTLEVPLLAGRMFDERDTRGASLVAVINQSMRQRYWGDRDPIGTRIRRSDAPVDAPWYTVVGIFGDVKQRALDVAAEPEVLLPYLQYNGSRLYVPRTLVIRTRSNAATLATTVRREIGAIDPAAPLPEVVTMEQTMAAGLEARQRRMALWSGFSALALALAILGVYAIVAAAVSERTQEIGVRIAFGARPITVLRMVIGEGVTLAVIGCTAGLLAALATTRAIASFLFGVTPLDPLSFAGAALLMVSIAIVASYVPARRSTGIDVRAALSYE